MKYKLIVSPDPQEFEERLNVFTSSVTIFNVSFTTQLKQKVGNMHEVVMMFYSALIQYEEI